MYHMLKGRRSVDTIVENIIFLARQDEDEKDSNFIQLLHLRAIRQPELVRSVG